MTREEFAAALKALGMNRTQFAEKLRLAKPTVYRWDGAAHPFPWWVEMLLAAWHDNQQLIVANEMARERNRWLIAKLEPFEQFAL